MSSLKKIPKADLVDGKKYTVLQNFPPFKRVVLTCRKGEFLTYTGEYCYFLCENNYSTTYGEVLEIEEFK